MGHFAKVVDGTVTQVIVAEPDFIETLEDSNLWVKTSYNMKGGVYYDSVTGEPLADQSIVVGDEARERKNFACIGWSYDGTGFFSPQPHPSWTLNTNTYLWEAPVLYPDDGNVYNWNEDLTSWVQMAKQD